MDTNEEDARNSLLSHFSSKSTNQTVALLGFAIAFFTVLQSYSALNSALGFQEQWQRVVFTTLVLEFILFLVLRAIRRLYYWGELATAITCVKPLGTDETKEQLSKEDNPKMSGCLKDKMIELAPACFLTRLSYSSLTYFVCRVKSRKSILSLFYRFNDHRCFKYVYLVVAIVILILRLTIL